MGRRMGFWGVRTTVVSRNPDILGGTPVFAGTRVPVQTFIDCLESGYSIEEFLDDFPSVTREQAFQFLEQGKEKLVEAAA